MKSGRINIIERKCEPGLPYTIGGRSNSHEGESTSITPCVNLIFDRVELTDSAISRPD